MKQHADQKNTHPAILLSLLPGLATLTDTDNDVQAVVTGVEALSVTLRAVTNERESVVLEVLLELRERPVWRGERERNRGQHLRSWSKLVCCSMFDVSRDDPCDK